MDFVRSKDLFKTVDEEGVLPCANAFSVSDGKVRNCASLFACETLLVP